MTHVARISFKRIRYILLASLLMMASVDADTSEGTASLQNDWCREQAGIAGVTVYKNIRCECLTDTHAVKFNEASRWAEAIGDALYYSAVTGRKAGIVLIMNADSDRRYRHRLDDAINGNGLAIDVWEIKP
ncbi:MAG: hypothetical protein PVH30_03825 [Desulfobacterales bacterium]|jgi:hypothetical protein